MFGMSVYARRNYYDGQILFNRVLFAFFTAIKIILKIVVYSPLLFLSYLITKQILGATTDAIIWLALILIFAVILYFITYFFKGVLIALKANRNLFWIVIFICLLTITCVLPVWLIFSPVQDFINNYTSSNPLLITWIFAIAFGLYVYSRYHFLTNIAPTAAYPYYQMGINSTFHLLNLSNTFKAKKSRQLI